MDNRYQVQPTNTKKSKRGLIAIIASVVIVAFLGGSYVFADYMCDKIAKEEFESFATDFPFELGADGDTLNYITADFQVSNTYIVGEDEDEKTYHTTWSSNSDRIKIDEDGFVNVDLPKKSQKVTLTETYKKFIGKYTRTFTVTLIPNTATITENTEIITVKQLTNNENSIGIQVVEDEEGNVDYMLGEFKGLYAYNHEDALNLINLYRSEFDTPEGVEFVFDRVVNTNVTKAFLFNVEYNGIVASGSSADVVVDVNTSEVTKVSINVNNLPDISVTTDEIEDYEAIINAYVSGNDIENAESERLIFDLGPSIRNGKCIRTYRVVFRTGYTYTVVIDVESKQVTDYYFEGDSTTYTNKECSATDDHGNRITFDATYKKSLVGSSYILYDCNRGISCLDDEGFWYIYNAFSNWSRDKSTDDMNIPEMLAALSFGLVGTADKAISSNLFTYQIKSDTSNFKQGAHAAAYHNLQIAYDFFKENLGLISYDGNGAPIVVHVDSKAAKDNAHWSYDEKLFRVGTVEKYMYPLGQYPEVMVHEYTHAVFGNIGNITADRGIEVAGLNEAYADIFGCLATGKWVMAKTYDSSGRSICIRDLKDINTNLTKNKFSETYKDEYWQEEEHAICTVIGHIGYEMYASGLFTEKEMVDIWYNSLGYVYNDDSTFLTCRKYVLKAAEALGIDKARRDFIAHHFDQAEIYDSTYKITTDKYLDKEKNPTATPKPTDINRDQYEKDTPTPTLALKPRATATPKPTNTPAPTNTVTPTPTEIPAITNAPIIEPTSTPTEFPTPTITEVHDVTPTELPETSPVPTTKPEVVLNPDAVSTGDWKNGEFMIDGIELKFPLTAKDIHEATGLSPVEPYNVNLETLKLKPGETYKFDLRREDGKTYEGEVEITIHNNTDTDLIWSECEVYRVFVERPDSPRDGREHVHMSVNGLKYGDTYETVVAVLGSEDNYSNAWSTYQWYAFEETKNYQYLKLEISEKYGTTYMEIVWPRTYVESKNAVSTGDWKNGEFMLDGVELKFPLTFKEIQEKTGLYTVNTSSINLKSFKLMPGETHKITEVYREGWANNDSSYLDTVIYIHNHTEKELMWNDCEVYKIEVNAGSNISSGRDFVKLSMNGLKFTDSVDKLTERLGKETRYDNTWDHVYTWTISDQTKNYQHLKITATDLHGITKMELTWSKTYPTTKAAVNNGNWKEGEFTLDGVSFKFPLTFNDIYTKTGLYPSNVSGVKLDTHKLQPGETLKVNNIKRDNGKTSAGSTTIYVHNNTDKELLWSDCEVYKIVVDQGSEIKYGNDYIKMSVNGLKFTSESSEMLSKLGKETKLSSSKYTWTMSDKTRSYQYLTLGVDETHGIVYMELVWPKTYPKQEYVVSTGDWDNGEFNLLGADLKMPLTFKELQAATGLYPMKISSTNWDTHTLQPGKTYTISNIYPSGDSNSIPSFDISVKIQNLSDKDLKWDECTIYSITINNSNAISNNLRYVRMSVNGVKFGDFEDTILSNIGESKRKNEWSDSTTYTWYVEDKRYDQYLEMTVDKIHGLTKVEFKWDTAK